MFFSGSIWLSVRASAVGERARRIRERTGDVAGESFKGAFGDSVDNGWGISSSRLLVRGLTLVDEEIAVREEEALAQGEARLPYMCLTCGYVSDRRKNTV